MTSSLFAPDQSEVLLRVVEGAPQVCRRHQFFVWTQGDFQRWLPHKISVCGIYDREQRNLVFDIFNSVPVPDEVLRDAEELRGGAIEHDAQRGDVAAARRTIGPTILLPGVALLAVGALLAAPAGPPGSPAIS